MSSRSFGKKEKQMPSTASGDFKLRKAVTVNLSSPGHQYPKAEPRNMEEPGSLGGDSNVNKSHLCLG